MSLIVGIFFKYIYSDLLPVLFFKYAMDDFKMNLFTCVCEGTTLTQYYILTFGAVPFSDILVFSFYTVATQINELHFAIVLMMAGM